MEQSVWEINPIMPVFKAVNKEPVISVTGFYEIDPKLLHYGLSSYRVLPTL